MAWAPVLKCVDCGQAPRTNRVRCRPCARKADRRRGSRQKRGLGAAYQRERRRVVTPDAVCYLCGQPARPDDPMTGDHVIPRARDGGIAGNIRPAHRSCNLAKGKRMVRALSSQ